MGIRTDPKEFQLNIKRLPVSQAAELLPLLPRISPLHVEAEEAQISYIRMDCQNVIRNKAPILLHRKNIIFCHSG